MRRLIGFAVAPISAGVLVAIMSLLKGDAGGARLSIAIAAAAGYPVAVIVGLPIDMLYYQKCGASLAKSIVLGLIISSIIILSYSTFSVGLDGVQSIINVTFIGYSIMFLVSCVTSSVIYYLIAYARIGRF